MTKKVVALASMLLSSVALADGFYGVGEVTHANNSLDRDYFDNTLLAAGATGVSSRDSGSVTRWRLQGGYAFNDYVAVEAGYIDFGETKYRAELNGGSATGSLKAGGLDVAALLMLPVTDDLSLFAKAGVVAAKAKSKIASDGLTPGVDTSSTKTTLRPLLGVGATYALSDQWDLRFDYDQVSNIGKSHNTGTMTSRMYSLGVKYNF